MRTIHIEGPYRFFFVSLDRGEPPHIHVPRENKTAKFWLDPVALERDSGFRPNELNTITKIVLQHREYFLEQWNEHFDS